MSVLVLVDTPIWSYALRSQRAGFESHVTALKSLITSQRVLIIGAIRQEILSGYSDLGRFNVLKHKLSAFHNTPVIDDDYVQAAAFSNIADEMVFRVRILIFLSVPLQFV